MPTQFSRPVGEASPLEIMPIFLPEHFITLLSQARSGSNDALGRLLEPFRLQLLVGKKVADLPRHMDAAELLQETMQAAVASFAQFRGQTEGELLVWLRQIAAHRLVSIGQRYRNAQKRDVRRQVSLDQELPEGPLGELIPDDEATPYTSTSTQERRDLQQRALETLKPKFQEVIRLHHAVGKSFAEIAAEQGKTSDAIAKTWDRALKAWRQALESLGVQE